VNGASATAEAAAPHPRVVIDELRFDGPIHLPDSVINEMVAGANNAELDAANMHG
jgi:hypothetical protein